MKVAAPIIVASLMWTACTPAGSAQPVPIELGRAFSLSPGQVGQLADGTLRVGFTGVSADSRCPRGEQCVWAGDATVQVWLQGASGPKHTYELGAMPGPAQATSALDHELRLVRLDPYPVGGTASASGSYVATLTLNRTPTPAFKR